MKKIILSVVMVLILVSLFSIPVLAAPAGKDIAANNNPQNLYLYPKEYADASEWTTLWEDEDWGKFNYKLDGQNISGVFNGKGLVADTDYTLISYNDPWGATPPFVVIGSGTANTDGNIHIVVKKVPVDLGFDGPSPEYDWNGDGDGYKIWLVLTDDIEGGQFNDWNPDAYLFENNRIGATTTAP